VGRKTVRNSLNRRHEYHWRIVTVTCTTPARTCRTCVRAALPAVAAVQTGELLANVHTASTVHYVAAIEAVH